MEFQVVPRATLAGIEVSLAIVVILPIVLAIYAKKKMHARTLSFFIGAGTFIGFALILEQILHFVVLKVAGDALTDNIWLYAFYGAITAGVFEETGRYVAMRFSMKENLNRANAIMYGAGHGGAEAILIVGLAELSNLLTAFMINSGGIAAMLEPMDEAMRTSTYESISQLWTLPSYEFHLAGIERILALLLQIAMSLIIYKAVKTKQKKYIAISFGIHFFADFTTVIAAKYVSIKYVEVLIAMIAAAALLFAYRTTEEED